MALVSKDLANSFPMFSRIPEKDGSHLLGIVRMPTCLAESWIARAAAITPDQHQASGSDVQKAVQSGEAIGKNFWEGERDK